MTAGVFAQRGRDRPNRIGITTCRVLAVDGLTVCVEGLDAVDGTPVLDMKPFISRFSVRGSVREPIWVGELMANSW
jgi:tRNA (Thr-GGU) A37 N-methylase